MELTFTNKRGDVLDVGNNSLFYLVGVDGQTVANSAISSVTIGGIDGDTVNNVQAQPRTIALTLKIKSGVNVEYAKRNILNVVKLKQIGTLTWTQNNRTVEIKGIVETVEMPRWENGIAMQITLHCEQPFWEDVDEIIQEISEAISLHYFTENINDMLYFIDEGIAFGELDYTRSRFIHNAGDVAVGLEIEIVAYDTVTNPIIYDTDGNFFGIGTGTGAKQVVMNAGDIVVVNTTKGNKTVKLNGVNIYDKIKPASTWLQIGAGDNQFSINSDDESITNMTFSLSFKQRYI